MDHTEQTPPANVASLTDRQQSAATLARYRLRREMGASCPLVDFDLGQEHGPRRENEETTRAAT